MACAGVRVAVKAAEGLFIAAGFACAVVLSTGCARAVLLFIHAPPTPAMQIEDELGDVGNTSEHEQDAVPPAPAAYPASAHSDPAGYAEGAGG